MRKLELDFQRISNASAWPGWLLLIAGILLCADLAISYAKVSSETKKIELSVPNNFSPVNNQGGRAQASYTTEEYAKAIEVVGSISFPWGDVFKVLESAQTDGISIFEFTPTPKESMIILRGEAASFPALLTYIASLEQTAAFYDVFLERYEIKRGESQNSIAFALAAHWRGQ